MKKKKHLKKKHCGQIHFVSLKKKKISSVNAFKHYEECNKTNKLHLYVLSIFASP